MSELNPSAKAFFTLDPNAQEFTDPFEYSDPEDIEFVPISPGLTMGVSKTIYQTGIKIGHITYNNLLFEIFIDNDVAILIIPDRKYDAYFPLQMSVRDLIHYYFGEKNIGEDASFDVPMFHTPFCVITV